MTYQYDGAEAEDDFGMDKSRVYRDREAVLEAEIVRLKNELESAKDRCYVLPDGECVSPFDCVHGPGLPMEDLIADRTYMNWLSTNLVYMVVKVIGYQAETLPNNGKGWAGDELRQALSKAIERQNEYNHIRKEGTPR
jgi:hypothetical protein